MPKVVARSSRGVSSRALARVARWALALAVVPRSVSAQPAAVEEPAARDAGDAPPQESADGGVSEPDTQVDAPSTAAPQPVSPPAPSPDPPAAPPAPPREAVAEVSVVGARFDRAGGSAHVLKDKQLRRQSYDDPHQVLLRVPGVYVRGEDGMGLRPNIGIRGANSDRSKKITLMEDGVLFGPAPYSAPAAYYFPLIDRMQTVRVLKGPSSIAYGPHTVGGAIDLVTREIPSSPRAMASLGVGSFGYNKQHLTLGTSDERMGFLIEGVRLASSGFKELDGGGNTGFSRNEWMVKGSYLVDPHAKVPHEIGVKLGYANEDSHETYLGLTDEDFRATPYRRYAASRLDRMKYDRTQVQLSHTARFSPRFSVITTAYRHDFTRAWTKLNAFRGAEVADVLRDPTVPRNAVYRDVLTGAVDSSSSDDALLIGPNHRAFVSQGVQSRLSFRGRTGPVDHQLEYGIRLHNDSARRRHTDDGYRMVGGQLAPEGSPVRTTADNYAETSALAVHLQETATWKVLTISPGVRVESIAARATSYATGESDGGNYQAVLPGVGTFTEVTRGLGILAGVHKGFSPPPPEQARAARPEQNVSYEAGLRHVRKRGRAELIGFLNDYSNLTNLCTFSGGCLARGIDQQTSAGAAQIYGLEAYAEEEIRINDALAAPVHASYTFTQTELLRSFRSSDPQLGDVVAGAELPYVPKHQAQVGAGVEGKVWGLDASGTYVGRMRERAGAGEGRPDDFTDAYFLLDLAGKIIPMRHVEVFLRVRNALDSEYVVSRRPYGARPGSPRWVQAGVKIEID